MEDIELDFGAISIDNSVLKGTGYRFNEGILKQMEQFKNGPVQVIQTDIVHNEAKKHIADVIKNSRSSIKKALRSASKQLNISLNAITAASDLLEIPGEDLEVAEERLNEYYACIGAEILESDIDCKRLMKLYFDTQAPFEGTKDKKNEFPDAIALISLEEWAEEQGVNVIAVSADKGWKDFAKKSDRITVIDNLPDAIAIFQPHNQVNSIIALIREDALLDVENHMLSQIEVAIISSLEDASIYVEASSSFSYEESDAYATYVEHELVIDDDGLVAINVVRIEEDIVVLQLKADVTCKVSVEFDFYVRDSFDKDEFNIGSSTCSVEEIYTTDILISLTGDFAEGVEKLEVARIEVLETIDNVDFGEVEPDYRDCDDEE